MIEDRELDNWREQWSSVAGPSPEFQQKIKQKIKRQNLRFMLGNVLTAIAFFGILIFGVRVLPSQASSIGTGWATGVCVLVVVSVAYRLWILRGTWNAETQSTRAFVELWHRRVRARIRMLRLSIYLSVGWIVFCAALTAINWRMIGPDVKAHPTDSLGILVASVLMQPVLWFSTTRFRRRQLAELSKVKNILDEMGE